MSACRHSYAGSHESGWACELCGDQQRWVPYFQTAECREKAAALRNAEAMLEGDIVALRKRAERAEARVEELEAKLARLEDDERPYWLWRAMLDWCAEDDCQNGEDDDCEYTGGCITEWCVACAAKAFRKQIAEREEVKP